MKRVRTTIVKELIELTRPTEAVLQDLAPFGWDSEEELATLKPFNIENVLNRFLSGEVSDAEVEDWANAIECRDDIGLDPATAVVLHELANPILTRALTPESALALVKALKQAAT